jgi:5-formyltetrahydrofolate cyclo-ligase
VISKQSVREQIRNQRKVLASDFVATASAAIGKTLLELPAVRDARSWFIYVSYGAEVSTHELIRSLLAQAKTIAVPRIAGVTEMIAQPIQSIDELQRGEFGILAPPLGDVLKDQIDVCICPGIAFTEQGQRLGSGRGYYDRFIAAHSPRLLIGLAYEIQIVSELPLEMHDRPMDYVITQQRIISKHESASAD